jgi:hypothetical protein
MLKLYKNKVTFDDYKKEEKIQKLSLYLGEECRICGNFTLEDLFKWIEREKEFFENAFSFHRGFWPLKYFLDEISKPSPKNENIEYLSIWWIAKVWDSNREFDFKPQISIYKKGNKKDTYIISCVPLNVLKKYIIRLDKKVYLVDDKISLIKPVAIMNKNFTLYDLIGCIMKEVSYYGSPKDRDKLWNKRANQFDKIMEEIKK